MLAAEMLIVMTLMACATVEKQVPDARIAEARAAFDEGKKLNEEGRYEEAELFVERALSLREEALGGMNAEVAECLQLLGLIHRRQGDYTRAEQSYQRALEIREEFLGKDHPDVATSLNGLANLYTAQGYFERAEPLLARTLAIREEVLGATHPDVAISLNSFANLYMQLGNYPRAESLYVRALEIREAVFGKTHPDVAQAAGNLANLYLEQGRYERAEPLFKSAIEIQEEALGKNHPHVAIGLNNLANLYLEQGRYEHVEMLYVRALKILETALGGNHPQVATVLNNLANLYRDQGRYAQAEMEYERALKIRAEALGENHSDVAVSLFSLADLYSVQGRYEQAEPLYERALRVQEEALGKDHPDVAILLNNFANLYLKRGDFERAKAKYERALRIRAEALGEHHPVVAATLANLANLYDNQGHYEKAESLYVKSLAMQEAVLGENHPDLASLLHDLANCYLKRAQFEQAGPLHERGLAIREAVLGKDHPDVALSLHHLARYHLMQQRFAEALPLFERAFAVSEEHLRREVFGFSGERLASILEHLRVTEEQFYALARLRPNNARLGRLALSASLLRKGRSAEEVARTFHIVYRGLGQAEREMFERLRALRTQLAKLSFAGPGELSADNYRQRLKELSDQGDALEADLARRSGPLRALTKLPSPSKLIDDVAAALPGDGVLVEFIAYRDDPLLFDQSFRSVDGVGELRYLAVLLFADGRTRTIDLGSAAAIDRAALKSHELFASREVFYLPAAQSLYTLVFRPLEPFLGKARRLFISPDGQLAMVPLAALHDGRRFVIDRFDITYLTSGKQLLPHVESVSPARSVVVLADPDFGSSLSKRVVAKEDVPTLTERSEALARSFSVLRADLIEIPQAPLPGTRQEAEAIQRMLPQAQLLLGREATKEALLNLAAPGVLHIATHGFFLEDADTLVATRAVGNFGAVGAAGPPQLPPEPLLRSGLVLAGAHAPAQSGAQRREDSLVTALELAGMDLWGTQLVVLSACDTGRGDIRIGQGVYGLRRALVIAGAQTLVTSLWKINDQTTRHLMESYYRNLLSGEGRAAALRSAMRELRKKEPHPHFWAPFIAIGQDTPLQGLARLKGPPSVAR